MTTPRTTVLAECGHVLHVGERAYSHYTCSAGVPAQPDSYGWFDFQHDDGQSTLLNGDRVCCLPCAKKFGYSNAA